MPRRLFNWTFANIIDFLKKHGFEFNYAEGSSHHFYINRKTGKQTHVPFHGSKAIKPRTMKGIIEQSGISKDEWFKY